MKRGRLITIGSFDGVHRGHAALLDLTVQEAKKRHVKSMALTFKIPPRMVLDASSPRILVSDPLEKEFLIKSRHIDEVVFFDFNKPFSKTPPFIFLREILVKRFRARGVVVGADFRFGMDRSAGAAELVQWGHEFNIPVWVVSPVKWRQQTVSSSLVREALSTPHGFEDGVNLLGHPYLIQGVVVKGRGIGKELGFPTANLQTTAGKVIPQGVFAVRGWVSGPSKDQKLRAPRSSHHIYQGVCNIGHRPTFGKGDSLSVEVFFLNFNGSLVGKRVAIELLVRLRDEKKFPSVETLKEAIAEDAKRAKRYFLRNLKKNAGFLELV